MINSIRNVEQLDILQTPAQEVTFPLTEQDNKFIKKLSETLESMEIQPFGLAANQIADSVDYIPSMFMALFGFEQKEGSPDDNPEYDFDKPIYQLFINPKISLSGGNFKNTEGCLSIPGVIKDVRRSRNVTITYNDTDGNEFTAKIFGNANTLSYTIQHEYDHLQGTLMTEKKVSKKGARI